MLDFDAFTRAEIIQLIVFAIAFVIGVVVASLVAIKETAELRRLRKAKRLMYEDQVYMEMMALQQRQNPTAPSPARHPSPSDGESYA